MKPEMVAASQEARVADSFDGPNSAASAISSSRLAPSRSQKLDLVDKAYQEYFERTQAGESLDVDAYCEQFPAIQSALHKLFQAHFFFQLNSSLLRDRPAAEWPAVGTDFLDYHLLHELGRGGFSRVYLATEGKLGDRLVAVKISQRGAAEAQILGRASHPNIVPVFSVQEDEVTLLSVVCMPYLGSATLGDVLDMVRAQPQRPERASIILDAVRDLPVQLDPSAQPRRPHPLLQKGAYVDGLRWLGACLADALAHLHERKIFHRDLKPSNVLMSPDGVPMLLDFNLSADYREEVAPFGGTLPYMAPEQLQGMKGSAGAPPPTADARADIFALGVMLYELATGQHPFGPIPVRFEIDPFRAQLLERQARGAVPAANLNPDVDRAFSDLIQSCLAVDPAARPQTAAALAAALRGALSAPARARRWVLRNPWTTLAATVALVAIVTAATAAIAARPSERDRHLTAGLEYCRAGQYHDAIPHLEAVLMNEPNNVQVLFARAGARLHLGQYAAARDDYVRLDKIAPAGRNQAGIGYAYNAENEMPLVALEAYRQAVKGGYAPPEVHNNMAYSYFKVGQLEEAEKSLAAALALDSELQAAYYNRAMVARARVARDITPIERKLKDPGVKLPPLAAGRLQNAQEVMARLEAGLADIKKATDLGPVSADLHLEAARLYTFGARLEPKWVAHALGQLEAARQHGFDHKRMPKDVVFAAFWKMPAYQDLVAKDAAGSYVALRPVVDPNRRAAP